MTIPQLARELRVSRTTVWRKVRRGQIHAELVGRRYIIPAREVDIAVGRELSPERKAWIKAAVGRAVRQYGPVLKRLSHE
jgi:excisionase family DNA binding protein